MQCESIWRGGWMASFLKTLAASFLHSNFLPRPSSFLLAIPIAPYTPPKASILPRTSATNSGTILGTNKTANKNSQDA